LLTANYTFSWEFYELIGSHVVDKSFGFFYESGGWGEEGKGTKRGEMKCKSSVTL